MSFVPAQVNRMEPYDVDDRDHEATQFTIDDEEIINL